MRLASKSAKLGQPEVKLGIMPGYGGSQRLTRLCGKGVANELCLTGEMISAEEALRIGLVNHVYEPAELNARGRSLAKKIIANAPLSVKYTMEAIERGNGNASRGRPVPGNDAFRPVRPPKICGKGRAPFLKSALRNFAASSGHGPA